MFRRKQTPVEELVERKVTADNEFNSLQDQITEITKQTETVVQDASSDMEARRKILDAMIQDFAARSHVVIG